MLCLGSRTDTFQNRLWSVPRIYSVRDRTTLPSQTMLHVRRSRTHLCWSGRKCAAMSSSPVSVSAVAVSVPLLSFSGSSKVVFRSPANISAVPQGRSLSVATTLATRYSLIHVELDKGGRQVSDHAVKAFFVWKHGFPGANRRRSPCFLSPIFLGPDGSTVSRFSVPL